MWTTLLDVVIWPHPRTTVQRINNGYKCFFVVACLSYRSGQATLRSSSDVWLNNWCPAFVTLGLVCFWSSPCTETKHPTEEDIPTTLLLSVRDLIPFVVQLWSRARVSMSSPGSWFSSLTHSWEKPLKIPPGDLMSGTALTIFRHFTHFERRVWLGRPNSIPMPAGRQIIYMQQIESFEFFPNPSPVEMALVCFGLI